MNALQAHFLLSVFGIIVLWTILELVAEAITGVSTENWKRVVYTAPAYLAGFLLGTLIFYK